MATCTSTHASGPIPPVRWITRPVGTGFLTGQALALDSTSGVHVVGTFHGTTSFFGETSLTPGRFGNMFIAKHDAAGEQVWVRQASGVSNSGSSVVLDNAGHVFVCGSFQDSADFDGT